MSETVLYTFLLKVMVVILGAGSAYIHYNGMSESELNAWVNGVPSDVLTGYAPEDAGIISGYVAGREDAQAGAIPSAFFIPEPYHHGYCHGYADNSNLDFATVVELSHDNAVAAWEKEVKHHG